VSIFIKTATLIGAGLSLASFSPDARQSMRPAQPQQWQLTAPPLCGAANRVMRPTSALLSVASLAGAANELAPIPLYSDLTTSAFPVTTSSPQARHYFRQGLIHNYGFNHAGAIRSFRAAQRLDPNCALCWWGEAVALGPNINAPMDARDRAAALDAVDHAMTLRHHVTPMETALIEAVSHRYSRQAGTDRSTLDAHYADAMLNVARRFPHNDDVAVLAAEAAMDTSPWNYWQADKKTPIGRTAEAVRLVEMVMARNPSHVQAGHLAIHLFEASNPARAEAAADRLAHNAPASAAHLIHMPAHIYQARGRYADSIRVNSAAARADESFLRSAGDHGLVRYGYYPHNVHFIVTSAQMAGDMDRAINEAKRLRLLLNVATSEKIAWVQAIDAAPYMAMAQFAAPDAILAMPEPDPRLPYAAAIRHYARAIAYAQKQDRAAFDQEISAMQALGRSNAVAAMIAQDMPVLNLLTLAEAVARGRFTAMAGDYAQAEQAYRAAIEIEDSLPYQEPAYWYYPVRQSLGAAQFMDHRYAEAAQSFTEILQQSPHNGWALYGLAMSKAATGDIVGATMATHRLTQAWLGNPNWLKMERL
jgi:tetratricopeptide (TPR) repeat protein